MMKAESGSQPLGTILRRRLVVVAGAAAFAIALLAVTHAAAARPLSDGSPGGPTSPSAAEYSRAVWQICAGALLFDHPHDMGTRADALEVAQDIRDSTARRLALVTTVTPPLKLQLASSRWISSQRRLAAMFADIWVRIYDTIEAAQTQAQKSALPERLHRLVHMPDSLKIVAGRLELRLRVPDCTGGG